MTREEAIEIIEQMKSTFQKDEWMKKDIMALEMAIKALQTEPSEDAISRQAVLEIIERNEFKGDAFYEIEQLPPIQPMRKRGNWGGKCGYRTCSECGYSGMVTDDEGEWIPEYFCPNCGSQMEEGE